MAGGGKRPGAGRPKGSLNKTTLGVIDKLQEMGIDPIEGMARIANNEANNIDLRARMYAELAQYIAPKRKAMEVTGEGGGPLLVTSISIGRLSSQPVKALPKP